MPSVFFYISGHGFGHASRQIEVINALGARRPDLAIVVRTSAPRWLFDRTARVPITLVAGDCDTGVVQIDSLRLDERLTIQRADEFYGTLDDRARREAMLLRADDARLIVSDAPPLGCAAAAAASIPSVVVTNFTWDWIYEGYAAHLAGAPGLLPAIRAAYRQAEAAWRLPMHGGFATFDVIVDLPFVARHAQHSQEEVRLALGLPLDRPLVLSSFGGYGVSGLNIAQLDCLDKYGVVLTCRDATETRGDAALRALRAQLKITSTDRACVTKTSSAPATWWQRSRATASSPSASPTTRPSSTRRADSSRNTTSWCPSCRAT